MNVHSCLEWQVCNLGRWRHDEQGNGKTAGVMLCEMYSFEVSMRSEGIVESFTLFVKYAL